jgi:hypothetical protein
MPFLRPIFAAAGWAAVLLIGLRFAPAKGAEAGSLLTVQAASVGFGGKFKAGFWQPVRLKLAAGPTGARGRLELVAPDGDQSPVIYGNEQAAELNLTAAQEASVLLYAKSGPVASPLTLQLRQGDEIGWSQNLSPLLPLALLATQELVVGIGPQVGLEAAATALHRPATAMLYTATVGSAAELPDRWWGYEGVDTVVLTTSDAAFLSAMSEEQRQALLTWIELGGRIVLCVGARGAEIAAAESSWKTLLPGEFVEVVPQKERTGLETFTKAELPFDQEFYQRKRPSITRLKNVRGEVLLSEESSGGHPLAVLAPAGLGTVVFVGLDLDHSSLAAWAGRPRLVAALLAREFGRRETNERDTPRGALRLGYEDISGQLRMALDRFPGVTLVNFTTISVLTLVYLLLIGPGDFLLLTRLGWPRHVTWLTFPLVTAGFVGLAWMLLGQTHGSRVRLNQVEIVDLDVERQVARGTVWAQLYSPATSRYDLRLRLSPAAASLESPQGWLSWQGLPGDALGGLDSRQVVLTSAQPYRATMPGQSPALDNLAVSVASSKSLSARWWAKTALTADSRLTFNADGLLSGEFHQPLGVELKECILAFGERLYRLHTLRPGQVVTIDPQSSLYLEWQLTLRKIEESKDVATPWDPVATDVPRIAQMLMFYDAARGRNYIGLTDRYQPYVDLSEHVRLDQAVLVGRAVGPVSTLGNQDGPLAEPSDTNTWTWYRLVFPVKPQSTPQP